MRMIRRHAVWVVVATLVGLLGAWLTVSGRPVTYKSTADIDVEARIITGSVPLAPNMSTEEQVAVSGEVLGAAAPILGLTPGHLSSHISVSVAGTSNILSIGCTMPHPDEAQYCAMVVTQAYLNFRNDASGKKGAQDKDPIEATLVTPATLPLSPAGTKKSVLLSIGAFLGFLLGLGAGYLRDRADDRVRDREDLSRGLGTHTVVAIPRAKRKIHPAFAFVEAPASSFAEAYRYLRVRVAALVPLGGADQSMGRIVLVTGPRGLEGSTSVASNLAIAFAQSGARVMLVDGNVRNPALSALYEAADKCGLTEVLAGASALTEVPVATERANLRLIPAGKLDTWSADIFQLTALTRVFGQMAANADVVIVDSAPVLSASDPVALAAVCDAVIVVADLGHTTRDSVLATAREIPATDALHVIGVLNKAPRHLTTKLPLPRLGPRPRPLSQRPSADSAWVTANVEQGSL
jgi:polysaccharide biosynthesis transport protein